MWEGKCETNLMRLLGTPGQAKKAAQFIIDTGELTQFKYAHQASPEDTIEDIGRRLAGAQIS